MNRKQLYIIAVIFLVFPLIGATLALAHGDKVIPQVPDGIGGDGTVFRTKFDLINLGPDSSTKITTAKLMFFKSDGTAWKVATNQGTVSEITLNLGAFQTIRIETLGTSSPLTSGYAIVRNLESTTLYAEDYDLGISVFYEVRKGNDVIDTISVAVGQPTVAWVFPVEIDASKNLYTGFAIANLSTKLNPVTLRLYKATTPTSGDTTNTAQATIKLNPSEQRAVFLTDQSLFPAQTTFKGMLLGLSDQPIATLALLQTPTPTGVQYATLVPVYADALRKNTYMYFRQGFPLDADLPVSDYFGNSNDNAPWDLLFETVSNTSRRLTPRSGAAVAVIGQRTDSQFDDVSLSYLQGLTYVTTSLDLSDSSSNLKEEFAFAIRTGLGRYVKVRIAAVMARGNERDLALEIFIYR